MSQIFTEEDKQLIKDGSPKKLILTNTSLKPSLKILAVDDNEFNLLAI